MERDVMGLIITAFRPICIALTAILKNISRTPRLAIGVGTLLCLLISACIGYQFLKSDKNAYAPMVPMNENGKIVSGLLSDAQKLPEKSTPSGEDAQFTVPIVADVAVDNIDSPQREFTTFLSGQGNNAPSVLAREKNVGSMEVPKMTMGYITGSNVFFRPDPRKKEGPFLQINDMVEVLGFTVLNDVKWYNVNFKGQNGWVFADYVAFLPVPENEKTPISQPVTKGLSNASKVTTPAVKPAVPVVNSPSKKANDGQAIKQGEAQKLVSKGEAYWRQKNWIEAYNAFDAAYKLTPTTQIEGYRNNAQFNIQRAEEERKWLAEQKAREAIQQKAQRDQQERLNREAVAREEKERERRAREEKQNDEAGKILLDIGLQLLRRK